MADIALESHLPHSGYHEHARPEMLPFIPADARRILDVGCGAGEFSSSIKAALPQAQVWGVEPHPPAHAAASAVIDRVLLGFFDEGLGLDEGQFDVIVFNDSLEHFPDHIAPLKLARRLLAPGGSIVASIPNVRYWPHLKHYVFGRDWHYQDHGICDRTHLRFFTERSIRRAFAETGFDIRRMQGINPCWRDLRFPVAKVVLPKAMQDILYLQYAVVATPGPTAGHN